MKTGAAAGAVEEEEAAAAAAAAGAVEEEEAAKEAAKEAAAKEAEQAAEQAAEAADGASVRKPKRRSVPAAARPSLLAQPLGPVVALRAGESTGSARSEPVARERRFGWDPDQARRRAGVPAPRKGEGSTRRRRQRPPRGTPRSRAPSVSCLPLSRLVRHRVISPSAAARGLGTSEPISACEALQSLVRVVCPGCRYLDGGGVHPLLVTRRPRSSAQGEAGFSVKMKRTMGLEPTTLGLGSRGSCPRFAFSRAERPPARAAAYQPAYQSCSRGTHRRRLQPPPAVPR
jgi:hypothetical protein